ncbi:MULTISPECIES: hypothetical protein [Pandoraea]|uniref:Uncharacterized protein n=2 Tax=Pandoraea TaxID=93217 RepID=A0A5E4XCY3_9BURK|nr:MULTISPECIES: hypothetical protein [Pandoraea]VVE16268.1 hypothetical protein PCE31107_02908 [Pandoraea cepalis]VVE33988.1 hypothetical protein PTE31013_03823 [Pandoraea terrigena]
MSADNIVAGSISKIVSAGLGGQDNVGDTALQPKSAAELEAEAALRDLDAAVEMSMADGNKSGRTKAPTPADDESPEATRARLMKKAASQREKGRKALTTPEAGIVMASQQVVVKDRVVGSALERYLGAIDYCSHNLQRYGEMVLGKKCQEVVEQLHTLVEEFYTDADKELGRVTMLVTEGKIQVEAEGMPWIKPEVLSPAVDMKALFRSRLGIKMLRGVMKYDQSLELMAGLEWNELIGHGETEKRQLLAKQALGKIYGFASHVNQSLRGRALAKGKPVGAKPLQAAHTEEAVAA